MRNALFATALGGSAALASGQVAEVVVTDQTFSASTGQSEIRFSLFLDTEGLTELEIGDGSSLPFNAWTLFTGVFESTAGSFIATTERASDQTTTGDWFGRRPPTMPGFSTNTGDFGAFRFTNGQKGLQQVRNGGLTLGSPDGPIDGAQEPSQIGGIGQDRSSRLEVFRGLASFDVTTEIGLQTISFNGLASFFFDEGLTGFTTPAQLRMQSATFLVIPSPAAALLLAGGLTRRRRR